MADTCEYVFSPGDWEQENASESTLDEPWECPHPTHVDTEYCIFHLLPERREVLGLTELDIRDALLRTLKEAETREECRFVGANFGALDISEQTVGEEGGIVDLSHADIDGVLDISDAEIRSELKVDCTTLIGVKAANAVLNKVSFRECIFEGEGDFDATTFGGKVSFRNSTFELDALFPDAVFEDASDFRYSKYKGVNTVFGGAEFKDEVRFSGAKFDSAEFTGATFRGKTDLSGTYFNKLTEFQYVDFEGPVTFKGAKFGDNSKFRGVDFGSTVSFEDATFAGWSTFLDTEFEADGDFADSWFKRDLNLVPVSENNVVLDFTGTRISSGTFEFDEYSPVFLDMTDSRFGKVSISAGREGNPFKHVRFVKTLFNGFDFGSHKEALENADYEVHTTFVHDEDELSAAALEKTYKFASEGAEGNDEAIASKFAKKEGKYRRQRHKGEGQGFGYVASLVRDYGVYGVVLLILAGVGVVAATNWDQIQEMLPI